MKITKKLVKTKNNKKNKKSKRRSYLIFNIFL